MVIKAEGFRAIKLVHKNSTAKFVFEKGKDVVADVEMPLAAFERGMPEMQRIVAAAQQKRDSSPTGIAPISYSLVQGIKPLADVVGARVYLILDPGQPNQIVYGIPMLVAASFVIELATEIQKWTDANEVAPRQ